MLKLLNFFFYVIFIIFFLFIELIKIIIKSLKKIFKNNTSYQKTKINNSYKVEQNNKNTEINQCNIQKEKDKISNLEYDKKRIECEYKLPPISLLDTNINDDSKISMEEIKENINIIENIFNVFKINLKVTSVHIGPRFINYEITFPIGMKLSNITNIRNEIALALAVKNVNIIPSLDKKNSVCIEVQNKNIQLVKLRYMLLHTYDKSHSGLFVCLGLNEKGENVSANICKMPNLIISGTTGSGVSTCINGIILSLLMRYKPDELKLLMIDPKKVEFSMYNGVPHLLAPIITNQKKASIALKR